jgi:hypothetical protein
VHSFPYIARRENKLEKDALNFFAVVSSVHHLDRIIDKITFFAPLLVFLFSWKQLFLSWLTEEGGLPKKSVGLFQNYIPSTYYRAFNSAMNSGLDRAFNQILHQFMVSEDCD